MMSSIRLGLSVFSLKTAAGNYDDERLSLQTRKLKQPKRGCREV